VKKLLNENYHQFVFKPHQHAVDLSSVSGPVIASAGVTGYVGVGVDPAPATLAAAQTTNVRAS